MKRGVSVSESRSRRGPLPEHPKDAPEYPGTPPPPRRADPPGKPLITKVRQKNKKPKQNKTKQKIIIESIDIFHLYLSGKGRLGQIDEFTQLKKF